MHKYTQHSKSPSLQQYGVTRVRLPQTAGSPCLNGGGAATAVAAHPGILTISPERQSGQMSKITNDSLTWSGTGCTPMATVDVKGLITQAIRMIWSMMSKATKEIKLRLL